MYKTAYFEISGLCNDRCPWRVTGNQSLIRINSSYGFNFIKQSVFYPLSSIPAYRNLEQAKQARQRNRNAYKIPPYGINLPCGMNMTKEKVGYVCDVLKSVLGCG